MRNPKIFCLVKVGVRNNRKKEWGKGNRNKTKQKKTVQMKNQKIDSGQYVDQTALLLDLQLRDEYRERVIENFEKIQVIAKLVNDFPLLENIEAAATFEP